jgi:hypothetical protein
MRNPLLLCWIVFLGGICHSTLLAQQDPGPQDAVKELSKKMKSPDLHSPDEETRLSAVSEILKETNKILERDPKNPILFKILKIFLKDKNFLVRGSAAYSIGDAAPHNPEALKCLIEILKATDYDTCLGALSGIRDHVESLGKPTLPYVEKILLRKETYGDLNLGCNAAFIFIKMGSNAKPALPTLKKAMHTLRQTPVADSAAVALIGIDPDDKEAKDHLRWKLLRSWSSDARVRVAKELMDLPSFPEGLLDMMLQALESDNLVVKNIIITNLPRSSQTDKYLPFLVKATKEQDKFVRIYALQSLGKLGKKAKVLPNIVAGLYDGEEEVRIGAANILVLQR